MYAKGYVERLFEHLYGNLPPARMLHEVEGVIGTMQAIVRGDSAVRCPPKSPGGASMADAINEGMKFRAELLARYPGLKPEPETCQ